MTKAVLEYDLDNEDDRVSFKQASKAKDTLRALYSIREHLRSGHKYGSMYGKELSKGEQELVTLIYDDFFRFLEESDISLDELYV